MKPRSIRSSFIFLGLALIIAFMVIGLFSFFTFKRIITLNNASTMVECLSIELLEARKCEKNFLLHEPSNEYYFKTHQSVYINQFYQHIDSLHQILSYLKRSDLLNNTENIVELRSIDSLLHRYENIFNQIHCKICERGFKDYGLEGDMRVAIHEVEHEVKNQHNDLLMVHTLMLRRHEKDFLLRKDLYYRARFSGELQAFYCSLSLSDKNNALRRTLTLYRDSFYRLVSLYQQIGIDENSGMLGKMKDNTSELESLINKTHASVLKDIDSEISKAIFILVLLIVSSSVFALLFTLRILRHIFRLVGGEPTVVAQIAEDMERGASITAFSDPSKYSGIMHAMAVQYVELLEHRSHLEDLVANRTQELERAKNRAEESDKLKSIFLSNMSHEVRTPLNSIVGFAGLLDAPNITAQKRARFIKMIRNASDNLLHLLNNIIDISRMEAQQMNLNLQTCDIAAVVHNCYIEFSKSEKLENRTAVEVSLLIDSNCSQLLVLTDEDRLAQVIYNLLHNALKYTLEGRISMSLKLANIDGLQWILISVQDTGCGIPPEKESLIFERFRQVEEFSHHEGMGLSLSFAKGMIQLLGGTIWFDSVVGRGTTFYFTLPYSATTTV